MNKKSRYYHFIRMILELSAAILIAVLCFSVINSNNTNKVQNINTVLTTHTVQPTIETSVTSTTAPKNKVSSSNSSTTAFTNQYGTATTKCAHPGCNNYIASSGDTNCCTTHSKRCADCGKYIDEDATYCMDCIKKAAEKIAVTNSRKCDKSGCSNAATKVLTVTQPSGESASFYLCSSHYSEYKQTFNSKQGWKAQ